MIPFQNSSTKGALITAENTSPSSGPMMAPTMPPPTELMNAEKPHAATAPQRRQIASAQSGSGSKRSSRRGNVR